MRSRSRLRNYKWCLAVLLFVSILFYILTANLNSSSSNLSLISNSTTSNYRAYLYSAETVSRFFSTEIIFIGPPPAPAPLPALPKNYFQDVGQRLKALDYLVSTSVCTIPNISPWDEEIQHLISEDRRSLFVNCTEKSRIWSEIERNGNSNSTELIIHPRRIIEDGYSIENLICCYKYIRRETDRTVCGETGRDDFVDLSSCIRITASRTRIPPHDDFIVVECYYLKYNTPWLEIIGIRSLHLEAEIPYRMFHPILNPKNENILRKIHKWNTFTSSLNLDTPSSHGDEDVNMNPDSELSPLSPRPPNVLIIGLDSTSRLTFTRNMPQTRSFLEDLGAVEMLGYTKVGDNTYPNFLPLITGHSLEDLRRICIQNTSTYHDTCPFIWRDFHEAEYLTAFLEDAPTYSICNYKKAGFLNKPTDFYSRPLFLAAHEYLKPLGFERMRTKARDCVGYQSNDELLISYLEEIFQFAGERSVNVPLFALYWATHSTHGELNTAPELDSIYENFLKRMQTKGHLENTILILMGDHGFRYGDIRQTLVGFYENKLPNMWIWIPERVKAIQPEWETALGLNQRRLTSPYAVYWTLNLILKTFNPHLALKASDDKYEYMYDAPAPAPTPAGEVIPRQFKHNFLEEIGENSTCSELGVPPEYCACSLPTEISTSNPIVELALSHIKRKINKELIDPQICLELEIFDISSAALTSSEKEGGRILSRLIVAFVTTPGKAFFEAEVEVEVEVQHQLQDGEHQYYQYSIVEDYNIPIHRTNGMKWKQVGCVYNNSIVELFCYCAICLETQDCEF